MCMNIDDRGLDHSVQSKICASFCPWLGPPGASRVGQEYLSVLYVQHLAQ